MTNLFAYRETSIRNLKDYAWPVGDLNNHWLLACAQEAGIVIAAWGKNGRHRERDDEVMKLLKLSKLHCLGVNKDGTPMHPLYLSKELRPIEYVLPPILVGDKVLTPDRMPVSYGIVKTISECGRYAKVEKEYGRRSRWTKTYEVAELRH